MLTPLSIHPLTEQHAAVLCTWQYPAPYDVFNWPSWEQLQEEGEEFADPEIREQQYVSVLDRQGELVGFAQFFPIEGVTRLGFGMAPVWCGRGYGSIFVRTIVEEALRRSPGRVIDLEVLTWNTRAIRAYTGIGFILTDTYEKLTPTGPAEVHCMVYQGLASADAHR